MQMVVTFGRLFKDTVCSTTVFASHNHSRPLHNAGSLIIIIIIIIIYLSFQRSIRVDIELVNRLQ